MPDDSRGAVCRQTPLLHAIPRGNFLAARAFFFNRLGFACSGYTPCVSTTATDRSHRHEGPGEFPITRAAAISVAVALFLVLFRPFGIPVDSLANLLVIAGSAPLNFTVMFAMHNIRIVNDRVRMVLTVLCLVVVNSAYFAFWSESGTAALIIVQVALVAGLALFVIDLWNRERTRYQGPGIKAADKPRTGSTIVLRGESDREVLSLGPETLVYLHAGGNYVDVHYLRNGAPATTLLRTSLSGLVAQVDQPALVQCHRSYFVNISAIQRIVSKRGRFEIEFEHGDRIPVSRTYKDAVLRAVTG